MRPRRPLAVLPVLLAAAALAPAAAAQSIWLDRVDRRTVHLEAVRPVFTDAPGVDAFSTAWFASVRHPLRSRLFLVVELPWTRFHQDLRPVVDATIGGSSIGNPYVGVETRPHSGEGRWWEAGIRLPLADGEEGATISGFAADIDRWEAFFDQGFTAQFGVHLGSDPVDQVGVDLRFLGRMCFAKDLPYDPTVFVAYGIRALHHGENVRLGVGFSGRLLARDGLSDFDDKSTHQVELAGDFLHGTLRPGVTARLPLDDPTVDASIGATLTAVLWR